MIKSLYRRMKLQESNKGFTLIELLVAISIAGAIMGVMTMTIITMMRVGPRNNEQSIVFTQVQNAGFWISRDAMAADNVTINQSGVFIDLSWADAQSIHHMKYIIQGTTLNRQVDSGAMTLVAEYINVASTTATWDSGSKKLTVTIKTSFGSAEAQRTYEVTPRPTS